MDSEYDGNYLGYYLYNASLQGELNKVKNYIQENPSMFDLNFGLEGACLNGNIEVVDLLLNAGAKPTLLHASEGGNRDLIEKFINMEICDWDEGLYGAARNGDIQLINYFVDKGATDWDRGYRGACLGPRNGFPSKHAIQFFENNGCPLSDKTAETVGIIKRLQKN
jgi:ankyrin repeat protein